MKNFELVINQRVIDAINYVLTSNNGLSKAIMAQKIGIKPAKFSEILNKRMAAGMDVIQNLCSEYEISAHWLITGEGEMLRTQSDEQPRSVVSEDSAEKIELLNARIRDKEKIIEGLKERIEDMKENQLLLRDRISFLEAEVAHYESASGVAAAAG